MVASFGVLTCAFAMRSPFKPSSLPLLSGSMCSMLTHGGETLFETRSVPLPDDGIAHQERRAYNVHMATLIPKDLPVDLKPLAEEIDRIHESALWSAQGQFEQMKLWRAMNIFLGVPAAVLAAIAGGVGLAADSATSTPGVLALISAGFGAALTALNPSGRVSSAQSAANSFLGIQTDARQLLTVRLPHMSREDALEDLVNLTSRRDEVSSTADPTSTYAYWRSKRNILKHGGQDYAADNESGKND